MTGRAGWFAVLVALSSCSNAPPAFPDTLDFGSAEVGARVTRVLRVENPGSEPARLTFVATDDALSVAPVEFVAAGQTREVPVTLTFPKVGRYEGAVRVTLPSGVLRSVRVTASSEGPVLSLTPTTATLDLPVLVNGQPGEWLEVPVTVRNVGTPGSTLTLRAATVSSAEVCLNDGCEPFTPVSVRADAASFAVVPIRVRPTALGAQGWSVQFETNDPAQPRVTVSIRGQVEAVEPCQFAGLPSELALITRGTVALMHQGVGPCVVRRIEGAPASVLQVSGVTLPLKLEPNQRKTLTLDAPGAWSQATLTLSGPGYSPRRISVSNGVINCLVVSPASLSFGSVRQGCSSPVRTAQVYNTCSQPITVRRAAVDGAGFALLSPAADEVLPPGSPSPLQLQVRFTPLVVGPSSGVLRLGVAGDDTHEVLMGLSGSGDVPAAQSDAFTQGARPITDLLFMVDTSGSFSAKRPVVRQQVSSFLSQAALECTDLRVAFAPAEGDPDAGVHFALNDAGQGWTPNDRADFVGRALSAFDALPAGSEVEACVGPAAALLAAEPVRADGQTSVVCITDALEQSASPQAALAQLSARQSTSWSAVFATAQSTCAVESVDDGTHAQLAQTTMGLAADVCADAWFPTLGTTGCNLRSAFSLTGVPSGPVTVRVNGAVVPQGQWSFDAASNAVQFVAGAVPPPGATVTVDYQVSCTP